MAKKKKKKAATKKKSTAKAKEMIIVQSKFKEALKAHGVNVSADAIAGANNVLHWYIDQAVKRTEANKRKTVQSHDFLA